MVIYDPLNGWKLWPRVVHFEYLDIETRIEGQNRGVISYYFYQSELANEKGKQSYR